MTSASTARQTLHQHIKQGRWLAGEKLPPERVLAETLGVKRMSLRQALLSLENEEIVFRIDRKGWFVAQKRFIYDPSSYIGFQLAAEEQGKAEWEDLKQETIMADAEQAADFNIKIGDPLFRIFGWGAFNGHRIYVYDVLINLQQKPDYPQQLNGRSISEVWIKQFNIKPRVIDLMIRPIRLDGVPQQLLGCTNGAPGLQFKRIKTDPQGNVIQVDREFWRFEMLELRFSPENLNCYTLPIKQRLLTVNQQQTNG